MGFGFRCGFRSSPYGGYQEGLEREYDLDLITTAPSVIYKVFLLRGEELLIDNPTNMPDPAAIDYMEEPIVEASIITPAEYLGNIMELSQERRGNYLGMEYIDESRVNMKYDFRLTRLFTIFSMH